VEVKLKKSNRLKIIVVIIILLLIFSNILWFIIYKREKNSLKHSITPVTKGDYYQEQLALVSNYEIAREEKNNYEIAVSDRKILTTTNEIESFIKEDVPFIKQIPNYPNGCEAVSATMLLQSYGIDITVDEFVDKYMKKDAIYSQDGERYGPDPRTTYAGDPSSKTGGFGIFEPGIKLAVEKVLHDKIEKGKSYAVIGSDIKEPLSCYMRNKHPIVIWATTNYEPVDEMWNWKSYNKEQTYTYPRKSHTIVVTGVDKDYYYVNDPLKDEGNIKIEKEKLEKSFDALGRQVVEIEIYDMRELNFEET